MKKLYVYGAASLAALAFASCSNEDMPTIPQGDGVSFRVEMPAGMATRAFADGNNAKNLYVAVYDATGENVLMSNFPATDACPQLNAEAITVSAFTPGTDSARPYWQVDLALVKNAQYKIVFWAESDDAPYTYDYSSKTLTVDYTQAVTSDNDRDAFYAMKEYTSDGNGASVVLYRPFAQVNVGTDDVEVAKVAGLSLTTTSLSFSNLATTLNLFTGETGGAAQDVTYALASVPTDETFPVEGYEYLAMAYVLPPATSVSEKAIIDNVGMTVTGVTNAYTFGNIPVQGNYRTNIYGSLLTNRDKFDVEIEPDFELPNYDVPQNNWSEAATTVPTPVDGVYSVTTPGQLAAIAKAVAEGSTEFNDKTIRLEADLDLGNRAWSPLGTTANPLKADFDGNGYTISNMYVNTPQAAGFIGYGWRKVSNVTFENATVRSNHWAGVVMGYCTDHANRGFSNITVRNSSVKVEAEQVNGEWDNGDKGGGIIGYIATQSSGVSIDNCTLDNVSVEAYRDAGVVGGYVQIPVTNTTVTNSKVILNGAHPYKDFQGSAGPIVGNGTTSSNTNATNNYSGVEIGYKNYSIALPSLTSLANTTLSITNCNQTNVIVNLAAGSTLVFKGNNITAAIDNPGGTARFGLFVNTSGDNYTLNVSDNKFNSSWSHSIYVQGNGKNATSIGVTGNTFADWGKKEDTADATALSACVKLYNIPNYSPAAEPADFAALPAAGQTFVKAFFNGGNSWTIPSGAAYTVLNMSNLCFTSMLK